MHEVQGKPNQILSQKKKFEFVFNVGNASEIRIDATHYGDAFL